MANLHLPTLKKAERAIAKPMKYLPEKQINEGLEHFCGSLAEAFKVGAEEAQSQMLARIDELKAKQSLVGKGDGK